MDFEIQIAQSITEIGQTEWDRLSGSKPFSSYRWYLFGEAVLANCPPTYVTILSQKEPLARAAFWLKRQEWLQITSLLIRSGVERLLYHWPFLACEAPLACASGLFLPESPQRYLLFETIARTALSVSLEKWASFSVFGYLDEQEASQLNWPDTFSALSFSDADTSLAIVWPDFNAYIKSLAKSTRRNIKLHNIKADEMGVVITAYPFVSEIDQAIDLIQNVEREHRVSHRPWTRAMLKNADRVDSTWITARINDHLVGCCLLIGERNTQIATLLGLNYRVPNYIYVYYQIIYALIRCAIEHGTQLLYGGGGAYELKRRLHFQQLPDNYMLLTATNPAIAWVIDHTRRWTGLQKPSDVFNSNNEK